RIVESVLGLEEVSILVIFKQQTACEIGLGIPAEPLFRSKEMTRKVSAEVDLVHQQTQNQRYGSSHIGATAKDISNVGTDAASGVVDIFHGSDKAVADTWNNFCKDGKADGIGSDLSRKYPSGLTPSQSYVFMPARSEERFS